MVEIEIQELPIGIQKWYHPEQRALETSNKRSQSRECVERSSDRNAHLEHFWAPFWASYRWDLAQKGIPKQSKPFWLMVPLGKWSKMYVFPLTPRTREFSWKYYKIHVFLTLMKKHRILMKSGADRAKMDQKVTTSRSFMKAIWRNTSAQNWVNWYFGSTGLS